MIGAELKRLRERRGMTQTELAKKLGLKSRISIFRWEKDGLPEKVNRLVLERIYELMNE